MGNLIVRLFIKHPDDISSPNVRKKYGMMSGCIGILLNLCLFGFKLTAGLITNAISITADAFNNLSDAGSSLVTLIGFKFAGKPADKAHPFGHGRIEYISGLFVSLIIIIVGFELFTSSLQKIFNPEPVTFSWLSLIIMTIAVAVKIWMYFFNKFLGEKLKSPVMQATAADSISDSAATAAVAIGLLIFKITDFNADSYLGIAVAVFIIYSGFKTANDSLSPLLGQVPDPEFVKEIEKMVLEPKKIIGIHDLIIHDYGPGRCMISLHAEVPSEESITEMHDVIDNVEMKLRAKFNCDATIHMDPVQANDELTNTLRTMVTKIVEDIDKDLTIHDFRVVTGATHTNLIFDVVTPCNFRLESIEISSKIREKVKSENPDYFAVIQVEKKYT